MPTTDRYVVQSAYRNAAGDWYGSTDPDPNDQWFFVRDTAEDASDWIDDDIAPGPYYEDVEATCKLLNRLARELESLRENEGRRKRNHGHTRTTPDERAETMTENDLDLFGERRRLVKRPNAYASPPGTGPDGKTCRTCEQLLRARAGNATVSKCKIVDPYGGAATDINMHTPACRQHQERDGDASTGRVY